MSEFEPLNPDDVVMSRGTQDFLGHSTAQIKELFEVLKESFCHSDPQRQLMDGTFGCQILSSTNNRAGWVKGKIRLQMTLEFCPDEPKVKVLPPLENSDLDEYRQ